MGIWFMRDNHTFVRLDDGSGLIGPMLDKIAGLVKEQGGYGFVGCKVEHGNETMGILPGDEWQIEAGKLLKRAVDLAFNPPSSEGEAMECCEGCGTKMVSAVVCPFCYEKDLKNGVEMKIATRPPAREEK